MRATSSTRHVDVDGLQLHFTGSRELQEALDDLIEASDLVGDDRRRGFMTSLSGSTRRQRLAGPPMGPRGADAGR